MTRPALLVLLLALAACATPIAPSGGPPDRTPPALVGSLPAEGAVNVTGRTVRLMFSERLDPSGAQAVTVTPEGDEPAEVRVRGSEIEIVLPELREATTYVVTVGTELQDQRAGVALAAPIVVAFATGPTIDRGALDGAVGDPETGGGVGDLAVWAYALADTLALPDVRAVAPDYRTGTGADGAFEFAYLRPGPYYIVAVDDRNRNGRADAGERFAAPPRPALTAVATEAPRAAADTTGGAAEPPGAGALPDGLRIVGAGAAPGFWVTTRDSTAPAPLRVRTLSSTRLAVRFDEPVRLGGAELGPWAVADSASGQPVELAAVYQAPGAPFEVALQTAAPLAARSRVTYAGPGEGGAALADSAGNAVAPFNLSFSPADRPDTLAARVVEFLPAAVVAADSAQVLARGEAPGVVFSAPPAEGAVTLEVDGEARPVPLETADGVRFTVAADSLPPRFTLAAGDQSRRYVRLGDDATGALVGRVEGGAGGAVYVEVTPASGPPVVVRAEPDGRFTVERLAPGPAGLRVWIDMDGDGRWSGGSLVPYRPAEPLRILLNAASVRARWDTEVPPVVLPARASESAGP
ncbi:Ig-like domain-containing protein [Rubrivirga sp. S365]|uniref:Ig-like domain-containing protein n=1 Tax=Rubrivirga sp. S365 TaxID=3076080 RepID=UPI0028C541D6|nr:Ig-like domain-containing protein [Rubrivirga sp. S365]MDT7857876.1 Ig-like domain-containing protein [Rubrivirga sp. S365]